MADGPVDAWCGALVAALDPAARRQLARTIAARLRQSAARRIGAQQNPDGSAFEPRKPQRLHEKKRGKIRAMFAKLRTNRFLRTDATADAAILRFTRDVERIAMVHQKGLRDRVNRDRGPEVDYPARELLGLSDADLQTITEIIAAGLAVRL